MYFIFSERISLIGSHFIPAKSNYKAFLSTHQLKSVSNITVSLYNKEYSTNVSINNFEENFFDEIELKVI